MVIVARPEWPKEGLIRPDGAPACGAKSRKGTPCMMIPSAGNRRCRMHGGGSPTRELRRELGIDKGTDASAMLATVRAARAVGDVRAGDPQVLDMRETIALQLSLVNAAMPLVINESAADDLLADLRETGFDVDGDLGKQLREALREVQFDRTMVMVNALSKVGGLQTNAIRVQQIGQLLMQQLLPTLADFSQRYGAAAERYMDPARRPAWREEAKRIVRETQDRIIQQAESAQNVAGR